MNNELQLLGARIIEKKYEVAKQVHQNRIVGISEEERKQLAQIEEEILNIRAHFISLFGKILEQQLSHDQAFQTFLDWGKEIGQYIFNLGIPLDEALKDTSYYRTYIWKTIQEEAKAQNMSADTIFDVISIIDPLLDQAVYSFSLTYVHSHQAALEEAKKDFLKISVPIVPLSTGVAILPLIGTVDTDRAKLLMEETLKEAVNLKLSHLIMDLSGVMVVDTMVADQIFKIFSALKLVGVRTLITGIRPEVAHTMVNLGLNFGDLTMRTNLQQAVSDLQKKKAL
ncbi:STAS domain-containing protein [Aneurinibacillus sp. Ricciae_BoGa-3]|uniref:STAS domain-containing protein n=1 Tax=Aneurinibacillus sp. Ricciae_BoGa-3 TaxID=3022697 RepID=UPI00233FD7D9|nr:STAS domain-containing protein [Aneurinibacillus sp. Ricciae_BoGa-3]WCK56438.1 STAS domain-containing protein [Aneurinibacillus sp. Ricciae_BoGa-3]